MFELNGTYVIFIAMFLVFMFLLDQTVLRPVGAAMEKRKARIQDDYELARAHAAEGESVVTRYENSIHEIRTQAQKLVNDTIASAEKYRDEKLKQVHAEGNRRVDQIRAELNVQRESLFASLVEPEMELVKEISGKLLSETPVLSISKASVERALEESR
jgi:F0F1-type ATP synthase membrane subunit b/b'